MKELADLDRGLAVVADARGHDVVQCKRYEARARPRVIRELVGAMVVTGATRGILVCVNGWTAGGASAASGRGIALLDYSRLSHLKRSELVTLAPHT